MKRVELHYQPKSGKGCTSEYFPGDKLGERIQCKYRQRVACEAYERDGVKDNGERVCIGAVWFCDYEGKWLWFYDSDYDAPEA